MIVNVDISSSLLSCRCHRKQRFSAEVLAVAEQAQSGEDDGGDLGVGR
jgi:hypothetical protein